MITEKIEIQSAVGFAPKVQSSSSASWFDDGRKFPLSSFCTETYNPSKPMGPYCLRKETYSFPSEAIPIQFIKSIELKDSLNSLPSSEEVQRLLAIWTSNPDGFRGKRPVRPKPIVFRERHFVQPTLRLIDLTSLGPITPPREPRKLKNWLTFVKPRIDAQRVLRVNRINLLRERKYVQRMTKFIMTTERFRTKRERYKSANANRMKKYLIRLEKYELRLKEYLEKKKLREIRIAYPQKFSAIHPHAFLKLIAQPGKGACSYTQITTHREWAAAHYLGPGWFNNVITLDRLLGSTPPSSGGVGIAQMMRPWLLNFALHATEQLETKATKKLYSKIANGKVHIGNMLAERHQTFSMLYSAYKGLLSFVLLKKNLFLSFGKWISSPKQQADAVLAWNFGVKPLINDIETAVEELREEHSYRESVSFVSRNSVFSTFENDQIHFAGRISLDYVAEYQLTFPIGRQLQSWGLVNPFSIAWEVTPWSFVVDWLIPIGSYIESFTADCGMGSPIVTKKVSLNGVFKFKGTGYEGRPGSTTTPGTTFALGTSEYVGVFKERLIVDLPNRERILSLKNPFSLTHSVEALALLVQRVKNLR